MDLVGRMECGYRTLTKGGPPLTDSVRLPKPNNSTTGVHGNIGHGHTHLCLQRSGDSTLAFQKYSEILTPERYLHSPPSALFLPPRVFSTGFFS